MCSSLEFVQNYENENNLQHQLLQRKKDNLSCMVWTVLWKCPFRTLNAMLHWHSAGNTKQYTSFIHEHNICENDIIKPRQLPKCQHKMLEITSLSVTFCSRQNLPYHMTYTSIKHLRIWRHFSQLYSLIEILDLVMLQLVPLFHAYFMY